jgi:hypothetical protein
VSAFIALQLPYVQNRLFSNFLQHLSHTTQFSITHQHFQLKWLYHASLTGLTIKDTQNNLMIAVDQLACKVNPLQLFVNTHVTLKTVCIRGAQAHLHKEGEEAYNINVLLKRLEGAKKPAPDTPQAPLLVIDSASLQDIAFSVGNQQAAPQQDVFDTQHFTIHNINAELANLKVQSYTLTVDIRHFTGRHADSPLLVDHLSTRLVVAPDSIQCKALELRTARSTLAGNCTLTYDSSMPLAAFKDNVHMAAHLNSTIAAEELAVFVPYFKQHKATYTLSGVLAGKRNDLHISDFKLGFGEQGSHLKSCISLQGLPDVQEVVFDMELQQGVLHTQDLLPYLDKKYYKRIAPFNLVKTKGRFYGRLANFMAQATFDTDLGKIATELEIQIDPVSEHTTYKGTLATSNFALGTWLNSPAVQRLTMHGQIDGVGLSLATAHFQLEASISKLGVNNYTYKNIYTHGHFAQAFFKGKLTVDDPHLKLQADAAIDLNSDKKSIAVEGVLEEACLQALQLTDRRATLRTQLSIAMQGLSWDDVKADAKLHQLCFSLDDKEIQLDTLQVHADRGDFGRLLTVDSTLLAFKAEGDFAYTTLASDFNRFVQGYQRCLMPELSAPKRSLQPYKLTYQLQCIDINPLLRVFGIDAYVSPNTQFEGSFSQQEETTFSLRLAEAVSIAFKRNRWERTQLALSARQSKDGQAVSAVVQLDSKAQQWGRGHTTEDMALAISWKNDQVVFSGHVAQQESHDRINLQGQAVFLDSAIAIVLTPTQGARADNQWHIHPKNRITLGKSRMQFQNFTFYKGQQRISLVGILSADPTEVLHLKIKDYALENVNPFVNQQLTGVLNATATLQGTFGQFRMDGDITLEKFTIDHVLMGDIHGQTNWNNALQQFNMTCQVAYLKRQTVAIQGFYAPRKETNNLQLTAHFARAQLAPFTPFVANHLSQLAGELNGTVYVHGSPANPRITGGLNIIDAAVKINDLNTLYQARGALTFADQAIHITTLHLSDDQQGKAVLQGSIDYSQAKDFKIDATGSITNFKLLNTASEDNKYFYGTGILSGSLSASGPLNNMVVCLKAKTDPDTNIIIPMHGGRNEASQYDFIRFLNRKARYRDKVAQTKKVALKGVKFVLLLEITPDAHTALISAENTGDAIKGRGTGNIKLEVDTKGVLTMAGEFEFLAGTYDFSLYRIVNRTFKILPESKITWHDSPTQGILNIKAVYEQRAALASLLENSVVAGQGRNKYPVQVLVGLQGALLSPTKSFAVNFLDYPGEFSSVVDAFKTKVKQDKKYAETQVLSLLLFKEFAHEKIPAVDSKVIGRNISALASQQLRNLTTNLHDNLEVDVDIDLATLGSQDPDTLHLDISYKFTDRLRVSRKSSISGSTDDASRTARLVGDWTAAYVLTEDGRLKAKLYNKYVVNAAYVDAAEKTTFVGGVSLLYTKRFNQWRELMGSSKRAAKKRRAKK